MDPKLQELINRVPGLIQQPGVSKTEVQTLSQVAILVKILDELMEIRKLLAKTNE